VAGAEPPTGNANGAVAGAGKTSAGDRVAEAKVLCDQASSAIDEGDFAHALQLAAASIKLRRTAKAFMLRARAEQRLGRVDDALSSLDAATELAPGYGAIWEQRGRILWAARRRDEARAAFSRFLELAPKSTSAPEILRLINEPR
jgi:tetratricopeptide (TPR) repeat protein